MNEVHFKDKDIQKIYRSIERKIGNEKCEALGHVHPAYRQKHKNRVTKLEGFLEALRVVYEHTRKAV